jgi:hypothetical protein
MQRSDVKGAFVRLIDLLTEGRGMALEQELNHLASALVFLHEEGDDTDKFAVNKIVNALRSIVDIYIEEMRK